MLQSIETIKGDTGDILCRCIYTKDAAGLVEAFQTPDPR
jgi:phage tail protein X